MGGPGLFVVAFLDSSFVSLPLINDSLVVLMSVNHASLMPLYALIATAGSVAGCYAIYVIAERGGEPSEEAAARGACRARAGGLSA